MLRSKFALIALLLMLISGAITTALACGPNFNAVTTDGVEVVCCELGQQGGSMLLSCTDGQVWFHARYANAVR